MKDEFEELFEVMKLDRKKSSWSREQTVKKRLEELKKEVTEAEEALGKKDLENLRDELGDVFLDLLAILAIIDEEKHFSTKQVLQKAIEKIKRRKPWIFTNEEVSSEEEVRRWYENKKKEKTKA